MKFIARHLSVIGLLLLASLAGAAAGLYFRGSEESLSNGTTAKVAPRFVCPMHPGITSATSTDCPECGMKLVALRPEAGTAGTKPAKSCCSPKPAALANAAALSCPHLASLTNAAPAGCCPHE